MIIIKPHSSQPGLADGIVIYSGSLPISGSDNKIVIQTELRHFGFCFIEANIDASSSKTEPFSWNKEHLQLGYEADTADDGTYNFTVVAPLNCVLRWFIIGHHDIDIPSTNHQELTNKTSTSNIVSSTVRQLRAIIANNGTSAVELINNTLVNFTYSKTGTGVYQLAGDAAIFIADKFIPTVQLQGETGVSYAATYDLTVNRVNNATLEIQCRLDGFNTDFPTGLKAYLSIDFYPNI